MKRMVLAAASAALILAAGASSASSNSISLDQSDPHFGDTVTFSYTVGNGVRYPAISVRCFQGDVSVYRFGGYPIGLFIFQLDSSAWQGGAADCTATLSDLRLNGKGHDLASVDFHVQA